MQRFLVSGDAAIDFLDRLRLTDLVQQRVGAGDGGLVGGDGGPDGGAVGLKRVDHVSLAVPDRDAQVEWQKRVFGFEEISRWTNEAEGYDGCVMRIPGSQLQFEIIAPNRPNSFVQAFLDKRDPVFKGR